MANKMCFEDLFSPEDLFMQMKMESQFYEHKENKKSFLVVEGLCDFKVFSKFVNVDSCSIIISKGKSNSIKLMDIVKSKKINDVCCVVDADFDRLLGIKYDNIILTDCHDLDYTIFSSNSLNDFLCEFLDADTFKRIKKEDFRNKIENISYDISLLRYINCVESAGLNFKKLPYNSFINMDYSGIDADKLIDFVYKRSKSPNITLDELKNKYNKTSLRFKCAGDIHNGHDISSIFGIVLHGMYNVTKIKTDGPTIESVLRLSFNYSYLSNTNMFKEMSSWELANKACIFNRH